jgi:flagellar motor protein MotB
MQFLTSIRTATAGCAFLVLLGDHVRAATVGWDDARSGDSPAGWIGTQTGTGTARWRVQADPSAPSQANVLEQSGTAAFPVCVKDEARLKDGFVEVKFKALSGKEDQAGGVVWRYRDADNYYVCRANALENNVVLYKVEKGKRQALDIVGRTGGYGVKEPVAPQEWHTLRVEFAGERFKVRFNGKALFEVDDATFTAAGRVGVWTKADSVTRFDDFTFAAR